jgi:hypothetical protein
LPATAERGEFIIFVAEAEADSPTRRLSSCVMQPTSIEANNAVKPKFLIENITNKY